MVNEAQAHESLKERLDFMREQAESYQELIDRLASHPEVYEVSYDPFTRIADFRCGRHGVRSAEQDRVASAGRRLAKTLGVYVTVSRHANLVRIRRVS